MTPVLDSGPGPPGCPGMTTAKNAFAPVLGGGRSTQPGADGGECLTHHSMIRDASPNGAADITGAAAAPHLLSGLRTTGLSFSLRALHLRHFGFRSRGLRGLARTLDLGTLSLGIPVFGFAFRSSGLPRFSGLWLCDRLGNTFIFDELGRRGRDRRRLRGPLLRRLFAFEGYAFFTKTSSGRQRRNNAAR